MHSRHATPLGASAVLLWSRLAALTVSAKRLPTLQLLALSFAVAAALGLGVARIRATSPWTAGRHWPGAFALAAGALAGYHLLYCLALRSAPPVDASLIAYLWPLLIVVFTALAHGGVRATHVIGATLGLAGAWLVISGGGGFTLSPTYSAGYAAAAGCALIWSACSVVNRLRKRSLRRRGRSVQPFCCGTVTPSMGTCRCSASFPTWRRCCPRGFSC